MTDTVKLIIEIPKDYYEIIKHVVEHHSADYRPFVIIANGTPLDDVKAKLNDLKNQDLFGVVSNHDLLDVVLEVIDNISKGGVSK